MNDGLGLWRRRLGGLGEVLRMAGKARLRLAVPWDGD